jgi:signal transduction histidine kinase
MALSLRYRIVLTLLPLMALLMVQGGVAVILLHRLGAQIDLILRENYDSVLYMERLNEALERIDSSFQFALAGREDLAKDQYTSNWRSYQESLSGEQENVTLPGEPQAVAELLALTEQYRRQGDAFYTRTTQDRVREQEYFGSGGLLASFKAIKTVAGHILRMNQDNMEEANSDARRTARYSLFGLGIGLAITLLLGAALAWHTIRALVRPIRSVTDSALAIGRGNLDQVVPVISRDELGDLAEAFNTMARQLRMYRESTYARLLRAQRTSQAAINSLPHPVLVVDDQGKIEMANPVAQRLFGVLPASKEDKAAVPWDAPMALKQPLQDALREQRSYLPDGFDRALVIRSGSEDHFYLPRILPINDPFGNILGAAVLLEDITRFRLLDQVKSDLVATASHELKTPLTGIRLAVHLLLEESVGPLTSKQTELLLDARDNAEKLLGRINSLLDLARLERGRGHLNFEPVQPAALLQAAADAVRPRAEDKGVTLVVDAPSDLPMVEVDADRLGHALSNLLENALTYTDRGGSVTLTGNRAGDEIELSVSDTGQGIPSEHIPHVFDRFFRIPGKSQEGGTGLGLAIVREIVTAHGGAVSCESGPGSGTVFHIRLPLKQDGSLDGPLADRSPSPSTSEDASGRRLSS